MFVICGLGRESQDQKGGLGLGAACCAKVPRPLTIFAAAEQSGQERAKMLTTIESKFPSAFFS